MILTSERICASQKTTLELTHHQCFEDHDSPTNDRHHGKHDTIEQPLSPRQPRKKPSRRPTRGWPSAPLAPGGEKTKGGQTNETHSNQSFNLWRKSPMRSRERTRECGLYDVTVTKRQPRLMQLKNRKSTVGAVQSVRRVTYFSKTAVSLTR